MTRFSYSYEPPDHWNKLCASNGSLFATAEWQELLRASFACKTIYGSDIDGGLVISSFKAGPFAVGYMGFPAGRFIGTQDSLRHALADLEVANRIRSPICLRVSLSAFSGPTDLELPFVTNPETAICDLQNWDSMAVSKKLRRDIRKVEKLGFEVMTCDDPSLGAILFKIYEGTVKRHSGSMRYTREYFDHFLQLSRRNKRLRVVVAKRDGQVAGFAATVREADITYYLHGGTDDQFRRESPSDLVLQTAINLARNDGCDVFNLMASPPDQPMLVSYKEKWGGISRELRTYTLALSRAYPLFRAAERLYRIVA